MFPEDLQYIIFRFNPAQIGFFGGGGREFTQTLKIFAIYRGPPLPLVFFSG